MLAFVVVLEVVFVFKRLITRVAVRVLLAIMTSPSIFGIEELQIFNEHQRDNMNGRPHALLQKPQ